MPRYQIITLIDITRTNPLRDELNQLKRNQQANFNSLVQVIGLRANITWSKDPTKCTSGLPTHIGGKATHWIWEFNVEREDIFLLDTDPVGLLTQDLHCVPIIDGLENSVDLYPAAFQTFGDRQNTWLHMIE